MPDRLKQNQENRLRKLPTPLWNGKEGSEGGGRLERGARREMEEKGRVRGKCIDLEGLKYP